VCESENVESGSGVRALWTVRATDPCALELAQPRQELELLCTNR
jgi:hypothetical protein